MDCPHCGAENPPGTEYCTSCNGAIGRTAGSGEGQVDCGACGTSNPGDAAYCNACGAQLAGGGSSPQQGPGPAAGSQVGGAAGTAPATPGGASNRTPQPQGGGAASADDGPLAGLDEKTQSSLKWWGGISYALGVLSGLATVLLILAGRFFLETMQSRPRYGTYATQPTGPDPAQMGLVLTILVGILIVSTIVWFLHGYFVRRGSRAAWIGGMVWYGLSLLSSLAALNPIGLVIFAVGLALGFRSRAVL